MKEKPLLQKHPIVMLPTNDPVQTGSILLNPYTKKIGRAIGLDKHVFPYVVEPTQTRYPLSSVVQHLYVLSNEEWGYEGNSGDWVCLKTNEIAQLRDNGSHIQVRILGKKEYEDCNIRWKKVIAITDPTLWYFGEKITKSQRIPLIYKLPTDFITAYIKHYNAGTPIEEILVEYEMVHYELTSKQGAWKKQLKLRSDGSIIIHPVKERVFTEDILLAFAKHLQYYTSSSDYGSSDKHGKDAYFESGEIYNPKTAKEIFDEWLTENYPD